MPVLAPQRPRRALPHSSPDAELVRLARAGDDGAYAAIYTRHRAAVRAVARHRLGTQGDPADVVQETFTAAWRHLDALREPERLRPWLLQIAARTAIDHGRRHRRLPVDDDGDALDRIEDGGPAPDDVIVLAELTRGVTVGIEGLRRRDATAIVLAAHLGFGPDEIAAALGVTPGNAKVILHRARRRLQAALGV